MPIQILRLPEVVARTGLSRTTIYRLAREDKFPRPVSLGARAAGWPADEVAAWIETRVRASREGKQ